VDKKTTRTLKITHNGDNVTFLNPCPGVTANFTFKIINKIKIEVLFKPVTEDVSVENGEFSLQTGQSKTFVLKEGTLLRIPGVSKTSSDQSIAINLVSIDELDPRGNGAPRRSFIKSLPIPGFEAGKIIDAWRPRNLLKTARENRFLIGGERERGSMLPRWPKPFRDTGIQKKVESGEISSPQQLVMVAVVDTFQEEKGPVGDRFNMLRPFL
jgi:hypothetical protein